MRPASDLRLVPPDAVRVNLTMPVTRIGFGPFSFDPVEQMIGAPLTEILSSLMAGPVTRRPSATGATVTATDALAVQLLGERDQPLRDRAVRVEPGLGEALGQDAAAVEPVVLASTQGQFANQQQRR